MESTPREEGWVLRQEAPEGVVAPSVHLGLIDLLHGDKLGGEVAVGLKDVVEDAVGGVGVDAMDKVEPTAQWRWRSGRWQRR